MVEEFQVRELSVVIHTIDRSRLIFCQLGPLDPPGSRVPPESLSGSRPVSFSDVFRSLAKRVAKQSVILLLLQLVQVIITGYTKNYYRSTRRAKVVLLNPKNAVETHAKCALCSRKAKTKANIEDQCERPCTKGES
jgi:hypothetical protein